MPRMNSPRRIARLVVCLSAAMLLPAPAAFAQATAPNPMQTYESLKRFALTGGSATVQNLVLKRDRAEMTFSGAFYFDVPVAGKVRGAVFMGKGSFRAEPPPVPFERENLRRLLKADVVESDFSTAVLRFTDDTFDRIGQNATTTGEPPAEAQNLAREFEPRLLRETGANVSARLTMSILNRESPGFFLAQFDKGRRDRFTFLLDHQCRIPAQVFGINGGEKGLVFAYRRELYENDVWLAFYSVQDLDRGEVDYSEVYDIVIIRHYAIDVDLRGGGEKLQVHARMDGVPAAEGVWAVPFALNEELSEYDSVRQKKALRLQGAKFADGSKLDVVQEEWESGITVFFPAARRKGEVFSIVVELQGDYMLTWMTAAYPRGTTSWYPRHGYLNRSTYEMTFRHKKRDKVATVGVRVSEEPAPDDKDSILSRWKMEQPVALVSFGVGPFERHNRSAETASGLLPLEFNSMPGSITAIDEGFVLQELSNSIRYFNELFSAYPYPRFSALFHPRGFGQGFPTMLLLPVRQKGGWFDKYIYSFIAHEAAHQWWGNIVAWRSYRDQWLSEGFAEYSGVLFTGQREKAAARRDLIDDMRKALVAPPFTDTGTGQGKLGEFGPIILGHRLSTRQSYNAYVTLIYSKGGLVLRMLHFLLSNPASGDERAFFAMMKDFVKLHENGSATSDSFRQVAGEHFARSPIAQKYGLKDLDWFFQQWVYEAKLPSYRLEYAVEPQPDGTAVIKGTLFQDNAPQNWFMPLPVVFTFGKDQVARGTVHALGPSTPVSIKLPKAPSKVELDPEMWVLSEKTSTKSVGR